MVAIKAGKLSQDNFDKNGLPKPIGGDEPKGIGGELNHYDLPEYWMFFGPGFQGLSGAARAASSNPKRIRMHRNPDYPVIFINGMSPNTQKHMMQALATCAVTGGKVTGIYNPGHTRPYTGVKFLDDLIQCVNLKSTSVDRRKESIAGKDIGSAEQTLRHFLQNDDPASATLFDLLCSGGYNNVRICAHSQGNIITANALNAFIVLKGKDAIKDMKVHAFGSPVTSWSEAESKVTKHEFSNDAITWLAFNSSNGEGVKNHGVRLRGAGTSSVNGLSEVPSSLNPCSFNLGNQFTHSYFLYLNELWDELAKEFK